MINLEKIKDPDSRFTEVLNSIHRFEVKIIIINKDLNYN